MLDPKLIFVEKRPARELSFKRRHGYGQKLTADDQVKVERQAKFVKSAYRAMLIKKKGPQSKKWKRVFKVINTEIRMFMLLS